MNDKGSRMGKLSKYQNVIRSQAFRDLSRSAKAVLKDLWTIVADNRPDADGKYTTTCSNAYIGHWSDYSNRAVTNAIAELAGAGFLTVTGDGPARVIVLQTAQFSTSDLAVFDTQPSRNRQATAQFSTRNLAEIDSAYKEDKTSNTRPETRPETRGAGETVGDYSRLICEVYPKHFGHSNTATQFAKAVDRIADQHESRERAAAWIVSQARAHWDHIASVCTEDPMTCSRVKVLHNWLDDSAYEQPNLKMRYAHLAEGALNRPYGASHAPDESRVNEIRERLRINRRASGGNAREAM